MQLHRGLGKRQAAPPWAGEERSSSTAGWGREDAAPPWAGEVMRRFTVMHSFVVWSGLPQYCAAEFVAECFDVSHWDQVQVLCVPENVSRHEGGLCVSGM
jgi:hypothetical protein